LRCSSLQGDLEIDDLDRLGADGWELVAVHDGDWIFKRPAPPPEERFTIEQIEQKQIGSSSLPFYTLRLAATNSLVLVPVANASEVGLRTPISAGECEMLLKNLSDDFSSPANDWKDRFKDASEKMRTGDIFEVADGIAKPVPYRPEMFTSGAHLQPPRN